MYGIFIGIHLGDGSIPKFKRPRYIWEAREQHFEVAVKIKEIIKEVFKIEPRIRKVGNVYVVEVQSKEFWWILTEEIGFPEGPKWEKIKIPKYLSSETKIGVINGLIGADGVIFSDTKTNAPRIRIKMRSENIIKEMSKILRDNNIRHTLNFSIEKSKVPTSNTPYIRKFWRIDIFGRSVLKLREIMGEFWNPLQERKFRNILQKWARATENRCPRLVALGGWENPP